jgi:hypothetical protein
MRLHTVGRVVTLALALLVAPLATKAQLPLPVIGYLSSGSPSESAHILWGSAKTSPFPRRRSLIRSSSLTSS